MKKYFVHRTAEVSKLASIGKGSKIWHLAQIRENAAIGENCIIGKNVYIDHDVRIGSNVKIQNNASMYFGASIEDGVFIGPHVILTNDKLPRAVKTDGSLKNDADWKMSKTVLKKGCSIGAGSVILPGITIGEYVMIGAGSVVTKNIPPFSIAYGNPASVRGKINKSGNKLK